jgi:hypothetical protein
MKVSGFAMKKNSALRLAYLLLAACMFSISVMSGTFAKYAVATQPFAIRTRVGAFRILVTSAGGWVDLMSGSLSETNKINIDLTATRVKEFTGHPIAVTDPPGNDGNNPAETPRDNYKDIDSQVSAGLAPGSFGELQLSLWNLSEVAVHYDFSIDTTQNYVVTYGATTGAPQPATPLTQTDFPRFWWSADGENWDQSFTNAMAAAQAAGTNAGSGRLEAVTYNPAGTPNSDGNTSKLTSASTLLYWAWDFESPGTPPNPATPNTIPTIDARDSKLGIYSADYSGVNMSVPMTIVVKQID